jgi:hypothetical protein
VYSAGHSDLARCVGCGYSLDGLPQRTRQSGAQGPAQVTCPECGLEQQNVPQVRCSVVARRLLRAAEWARDLSVATVLVAGLFLALTITTLFTGAYAAGPLAEYLAASDLAQGDELDSARYTDEVARQMFKDSGGWWSALNAWIVAAILGATALAFLLGAVTYHRNRFMPRWTVWVLVLGCSAGAACIHNEVARAASHPLGTDYAPSGLAVRKVGIPVSVGVLSLQTVAALIGVQAARRPQEPEESG